MRRGREGRGSDEEKAKLCHVDREHEGNLETFSLESPGAKHVASAALLSGVDAHARRSSDSTARARVEQCWRACELRPTSHRIELRPLVVFSVSLGL